MGCSGSAPAAVEPHVARGDGATEALRPCDGPRDDADAVRAPVEQEVALAVAASEAVATALLACRTRLDLGDATGAEEVLLAALRPAPGEDAGLRRAIVTALRSSAEYAETLRDVTAMEQVVHDALGPVRAGAGDWVLATEVAIDYASLGMAVDEEARKALQADGAKGVKIFYATQDKTLNLKITGLLPTRVGFALPALASFVAMYHETALWKQWHPIVQGSGAIELWPRRPYHNLWHVPFKVFMQSEIELVEERMFFIRDRGAFVMHLDGKPPQSEMWKRYPPPKGYKAMPGANRTRLVSSVQKHTTAFTLTVTVNGEVALPGFVVRFIVGWFLPEVVRRMLRAGAACLKSDGPHSDATRADADGVYGECVRLAARGAELDEIEGRGVLLPGSMPPEAICGPRASLAAFERDYLRDKAGADDSVAAASPSAQTTPGGQDLEPPVEEQPRLYSAPDDALAEVQLAERADDDAPQCCWCGAGGTVRL